MAVQMGTTVRNARLDQIETTVGTSPHFYVRSGAQPADCGTADSGSVIIDLTLPSDWLAAAQGGTKAKSGSWSGSATGTFTAGHFRIKDNGATTCHMQGSCGQGSGDLSFDNSSIVSGQTVTVQTFVLTEGNAQMNWAYIAGYFDGEGHVNNARMTESRRRLWEDPEFRARQLHSLKTNPRRSKRMSEANA